MRGPPAHDFREQPECQLEMQAGYFLALVDLDSYPAFVAKNADRFDLIQHLCAQRGALTATFWEVPPTPLRLQIKWAPDEGLNNSLIRGGPPLATGVVRSSGRLGLMDDEELLVLSRQNSIVAGSPSKENFNLLLIEPGVYSVSIFNSPSLREEERNSQPSYTVIFTYHAHPAPRPHPIRINAHLPFGGSGPLDHADSPHDSRDSHKMPR